MFIAILTYKKPLSEVDRFLAHTVNTLPSIMPLEISSPQVRRHLVWVE